MSDQQAEGPLANFQFSGALNRRKLEELLTGKFIEAGENLIICGGEGTGKHRIASAIKQTVFNQGKTVEHPWAPAVWGADQCLFPPNGSPRSDRLFDCDLLVVEDIPHWFRRSKALALLIGLRCELGKSSVVIIDDYLPNQEETFSEPLLPWRFHHSRFATWLRSIKSGGVVDMLATLAVNFNHHDLVCVSSGPRGNFDPLSFEKKPVWHYLHSGARDYRKQRQGQQ